MSCAHRRVSITVIDGPSWVVSNHYCSDDAIGERSVCKLARDKAKEAGLKLGKVMAKHDPMLEWEVTAWIAK